MLRRVVLVSLLLGALSACSSVVSRSDPRMDGTRSYELQGITFTALPDLVVSEANSYYPSVDVVWRGDPLGDRITQIGTMFQEAARRNVGTFGGTRPIIADIVLTRFHGVTERTNYSYGGTHDIRFLMTVRDARTGEVLEPQRRIVAELDAPGGEEAVRLNAIGQTQRVRVTDFLASVLRDELR
ncbi:MULTISPECIES: DUF6778 family protein [unclassified Yoonia]|uniref:DUF6778 family protein n=1 Tax=unclassified Yoonia TaxID=2629118 RepID=UPI002AFE9721|nr:MULTISPECIES: DUF6778 family protein [unclassified Yoonia]